jgi:TonB family protein
MMWRKHALACAALAALSAAPLCAAEPEAPRTAGVDVPAPEVKKKVEPTYPAAAMQQGISGIVIVEVIIDETGSVVSTELVRSIPGLDRAAVDAVRQWKFEITRVDGKPVRVRHVVALSFARRLPDVIRQKGIPELRQGTVPVPPRVINAPRSVRVVAELTLAADGSVLGADLQRGEEPWAAALLAAVRSWRFAPGEPNVTISFRVEAEFLESDGADARVALYLTGLRRSETLATPPPAPSAATTPAPPAITPTPGAAAAPPEPAAALTPTPPPASPATAQASPSAAEPTPLPSTETAAAAADTEIISAPPAPPPAPPVVPRSTLPGSSAVVGVTLGAGVPDLVTGRRPVVPPLARMRKASGTVEVRFSVDGAGRTTVHEVTGSELLRPQADQAVRTWTFRRTTPERLFLVAQFTYEDDKASAAVDIRE